MKCRNIQKKLSAYQDRELEPREQEQVRSHLLSCRACREQYEKLERVWQTLGALKEIHPDPWFYRQFIEKIKEPREGHPIPRLRWAWRLLPAPAIASILLLIGILAGTYLGNILFKCGFFPFQSGQPIYSQEALFDSLKAFDPAPPGTLAGGYLWMVSDKTSP
jgi:predicted anti-sigma-YlaC factor YlaD